MDFRPRLFDHDLQTGSGRRKRRSFARRQRRGRVGFALVVALSFGIGLCGSGGAAIALSGAVAGNMIDSMLGATIERRGLVTNGIVNFAGSSFAGALALAIALHMGF